MIYHGGLGSNKVGHATSTDRLNWTKDTANPILGDGVNGEAGDTLAVNAWPINNDYIHLRYVNNFTTSSLRDAIYNPSSGAVTALGAVYNPATGAWPAGFGNNYSLRVGAGWIGIIEGYGVGPGQFEVGFMRGYSPTDLVTDTTITNGSSSYGPFYGANLTYASGATLNSWAGYPISAAGGPYMYVSQIDGLVHCFLHGDDTAAVTSCIYHRATPNGIDAFEGPTDIITENTLTTLPSQNTIWNQNADPYIHFLENGVAPIMYYEEYSNANSQSNICARTYNGTMEELLQDSVRMEVTSSLTPLTTTPTDNLGIGI